MKIDKTQNDIGNYAPYRFYYSSARAAMYDFLRCAALDGGCHRARRMPVLLPAYIGVSPKEGSGVFDLVVELEKEGLVRPVFYRVTEDLRIDIFDALDQVDELGGNPFVFLKINYFGFSDMHERPLYDAVRKKDGLLLEDNAHGFFSFQNSKEHFCDASFFSLHKQFPFAEGGMLQLCNDKLANWAFAGRTKPKEDENPFLYDFTSIANICRRNFDILENLCSKRLDLWIPIRTLRGAGGAVPHSYPLVLRFADRFAVYKEMNSYGYGVTSLYHTMIDPIRENQRFEASQKLSSRILNLPVHQDVDCDLYPDLVAQLARACTKNRSS